MDMTVHHADLVDIEGQRLWMVSVEKDTGNGPEVVSHVFPEDTLEWRAAEYGIDPADTDTLLEMVLYEAHLTDEDPASTHPLYISATREEARAAQLARIQAVKGAGKVRGVRGRSQHRGADPAKVKILLESGVDDPVAVIKRESPIHAEVIALKRERVERARERLASARASRPARIEAGARSVTDRVAEARERLRFDDGLPGRIRR